MITQSVIAFINSFTVKFKTKIKLNRAKNSSVREYTSDCHSYLIKYWLHVEIIPANMVARQVQDYYNIRFFMYKGATALTHNTVIAEPSAS